MLLRDPREENERRDEQFEGGRVETDDFGLNSEGRRNREDQDIGSGQSLCFKDEGSGLTEDKRDVKSSSNAPSCGIYLQHCDTKGR